MGSSRGYASFHALVIMVFVTMAGAYLLRSASKDASTAGSYFRMRSAASASQAGQAAAVSQLQTDTALAMSILDDYVHDNRYQWLLGASGATRTANSVTLPGTGENFATRILAFDPNTGLIKIESQGSGLGGSAGRITGLYRLDGLKNPMAATPAVPALYVAADNQVANVALSVTGGTYFGGGAQLLGTGNDFNGTFKSAALGGSPVVIQGSTTFRGDAYFETPVTFRAGTTTFAARVGFDDDAALNATARLTGSGMGAFANGILTGSQRLDLGRNPFVHSGYADPLKTVNASSIRKETGLDVPGKLGMYPGEEEALGFDISAIPPEKIFTLDQMGFGPSATGMDLFNAFHAKHQEDRIGPRSQFMVVVVDRPFAFVRSALPTENESFKWYVWIVKSTLTVNGNLFTSVECPPPSYYDYLHPLQIFYVVSGGSIVGFGGSGRFRGYINVTGTGKVTYQWGPGGSFEGAIHHVSATSGFTVLPTSSPMKVTYDPDVLDRVRMLGITVDPVEPALPTGGTYLSDAKLRPKLMGMYY